MTAPLKRLLLQLQSTVLAAIAPHCPGPILVQLPAWRTAVFVDQKLHEISNLSLCVRRQLLAQLGQWPDRNANSLPPVPRLAAKILLESKTDQEYKLSVRYPSPHIGRRRSLMPVKQTQTSNYIRERKLHVLSIQAPALPPHRFRLL